MRNWMDSGIGYMKWSTYTKIFESGIPYSIKLNWRGEPLLHKEIGKMVRYAKAMGVIDVRLNTNGTLLDRETAIDLADAGLDYLIISVDGATKETYEKIRIGGNFEDLVNNIIRTFFIYSRLKRVPKVRIQMCKQPDNEDEIPFWKTFFGLYADELRIGTLHDPQGKAGYNRPIPKSCNAPWQRITVAWDGRIFPCPSDYIGHFYIGHINQISLKEAWHSSRMNYLRHRLVTGGRKATVPCNKCSSYC